jgi:hypothetical protein
MYNTVKQFFENRNAAFHLCKMSLKRYMAAQSHQGRACITSEDRLAVENPEQQQNGNLQKFQKLSKLILNWHKL